MQKERENNRNKIKETRAEKEGKEKKKMIEKQERETHRDTSKEIKNIQK